MPHELKVGSHVKADFGSGRVIAHVATLAHDVPGADGPETKFGIQAPDGSVHDLAYREPPYDSGGSGGTFSKI